MKKIVLVLLPIIFATSCESDNDSGTVTIQESWINNQTTKNEDGKYINTLTSLVKNTKDKDVNGYIKYSIKDLGYINSTSQIVKKGEVLTSFITSFETDEVGTKEHLTNAEFVED